MDHSFSMDYKTVSLVPLTLEDSLEIRIIRNARKEAFVYNKEIDEASQREWFERYLATPDDYMFAIYCEGTLAGQVGLYEVNQAEGVCEFGRIVVDARLSGRKIGFNSTVAACSIAFDELRLKKVQLEVLSDNEPAKALYVKVGFEQVGERQLDDGRVEYIMVLDEQALKERRM